jgi:hypothetical protein
MSRYSTMDILKWRAVFASIIRLTQLLRYYSMPGRNMDAKLSLHYLKQRRHVMERYGVRHDGLGGFTI